MFGFFSKQKSPCVATIAGDGTPIIVQPGENLLKAALDQGYPWPYSCRVGSCGTCRCRLISGTIKPLNDFSYVLSGEEIANGMILACQTSLRSDIKIEVAIEATGNDLARAKTVNGTIAGGRHLTHDIIELRIQVDEPMPSYLAGQYADLTVPGVIDKPRSYSFASAPSKTSQDSVDFFVRLVPGGALTDWLHSGDRIGVRVALHGPHGSFWLRESNAPMICVAGGSGLAPIKALLEQIMRQGFTREVAFVFGARTQRDLYCLDEMDRITASSNGRFSFTPVLSAEPPESDWGGSRGFVSDFISDSLANLHEAHAYLCGPPPMVDAAVEQLRKAGVCDNSIYYDKFFDAASMPGGR